MKFFKKKKSFSYTHIISFVFYFIAVLKICIYVILEIFDYEKIEVKNNIKFCYFC